MSVIPLVLWSAFVVGAVLSDGDADADVEEEMSVFVSEVLLKTPKNVLRLKVGDKEIHFGTEVTPSEAKEEPEVVWDADADAFYTLCLTNPDIPTPEQHIFGELNHWLVANIPGANLSQGEPIRGYLSPGPPKGSGVHRYIFLVFKQPGELEFDEPRNNATTLDDRFHFSIQKFAEKYKFELPALAGNYFRASWDPTVDELAQIRKFKGQIVATIHP